MKHEFTSINGTGLLRKCDPKGCGNFGASRGNHTHRGIDFHVIPNQQIKAPFPCTVNRYGYPYSDDSSYKLIEIVGTGAYSNYRAKIMYINTFLSIGDKIDKGDLLCTADDITQKYGSEMTPHVHFELYVNNELVNPTNYFKNLV
ncbi:peptidoglycan DD-metalloendopeptidase family protein [Joostella sp.]|uniref:peptidoglycan DD-metalloendopeptidase family protein n=1 Tax=Joostella sp. TaxID=2231138 RepID=UPI003A92E643